MYTVESDLLEIKSKKLINIGKGIANAIIVPKKVTHRNLGKDDLVLTHNSEHRLNIFYSIHKDHRIC